MSDQAVVAGIIVQGQEVLLIKRALPEGRLIWQFPAGKVEPNEKPEAATLREIAQETGLAERVVRSLGDWIHPDTGVRVHYFECEPLAQIFRYHLIRGKLRRRGL